MTCPIVLRKILIVSISALFLAGGFIVRPQENRQPPKATFSVNVDVVNVFVTVRDKRGNIIRDLTAEDFVLSEDGRKQTIQYFSRETDLPLTIGLIVDTTPSENKRLGEEKAASGVFLDKMLRPGEDNAFVVQFGYQVELLGGVTSSRERLARALDQLEPHTQRFGDFSGLNTVLADAIRLASDKIMKTQQGRKALILLCDGGHVGDRGKMAVTSALEADTLIYGIRIFDQEFLGRGGSIGFPPGFFFGDDYVKNMRMLSDKTGGAYFEISKKVPLDQIYAKIEEELRSQYSLGYAPDSKARNGYRKIKIELRKKGMVVRGREGYYPRSRNR